MLRRLVVVALLVPPAAPLAGCSTVAYLAEQGRGQLHLLKARRRIRDVLDDPAVPEDTKARLRLARRARDFGVRVLGLRGGDAYTRFLDTGAEPIAWSVYAAPRDRLEPYLHRFPITGAVPYLGFFDKASAEKKQAELDARGLDTYLVPVSGYSTLGFTSDPVYSSMIDGSPARIVEVVLHEMLHGTLYRPGHAEWNESLATLVGFEGAARFFAEEAEEEHEAAAQRVDEVRAEARERDRRETEMAAFLQPLVAELVALYARDIPREEKLRLREPIFERAAREYRTRFPPRPPSPGERPRLRASRAAGERQRLNNAVLLSLTTYHRSTPALRAELAAARGDLRLFLDRLKRRYGGG